MTNRASPATYDSPLPFDSTRIGAAAVYCSDGRLGDHFDDLLQEALALPRYDRLALPGGAACLAGHFQAYREEEAALVQLQFLVAVHRLERVVLVAHENCAFYTHHLKISPIGLADVQRKDLAAAIRRVRQVAPRLELEAWFARLQGGAVSFERVAS